MKINQNSLTLLERIQAPTPKLFGIIRNAGIVLATLAGVLMRLQEDGIDLPAFVAVLAHHATWISGIIAAIVAQLTVDFDKLKKETALSSLKK